MLSFRRTASLLAVAATALGAVIFGGTSASAETVTVKYQCATIVGGLWYYDWRITIAAPAVATHGDTVTLNIGMELIGDPVSQPIAAHTNGTSLDISLGGASTGVVTTVGMWNPEIPAGGHIHTEGGTAEVALTNVGNVTFIPVKFVWAINFGGTNSGLFCFVRDGFRSSVAATTRVI